jgi:hypothetical protein
MAAFLTLPSSFLRLHPGRVHIWGGEPPLKAVGRGFPPPKLCLKGGDIPKQRVLQARATSDAREEDNI